TVDVMRKMLAVAQKVAESEASHYPPNRADGPLAKGRRLQFIFRFTLNRTSVELLLLPASLFSLIRSFRRAVSSNSLIDLGACLFQQCSCPYEFGCEDREAD